MIEAEYLEALSLFFRSRNKGGSLHNLLKFVRMYKN